MKKYKELNEHELTKIRGGEGFFYNLGRAAGHLADKLADVGMDQSQ